MTESSIFLKLCEIKVSLCSKNQKYLRKPRQYAGRYLQLFIFLVLCWVLQGMMWPSGYRHCIFSGDISGSDLAAGFFFFCKFHPSCFQVSFCSPLLVSVFLILLIISVKFTYSINRKLYFNSGFIQLTKLCVINGLVGHGLLGYHFPSFLRKLRSEF